MKKKMLLITLLVVLVNFFIPFKDVQAATPYLKKLNVKFDLEENTWTTIRTNWAGNVWVKSRAMIKNIKFKNDSKKGYKKLKCDILFERFKPTKKQVKTIMHSKYFRTHNDIGGGECYWWILDYNNGKLEKSNVNIKQKWSFGKLYKNKDYDGCWFETCSCKCKLTVTYPEEYKDLCIGISGNGSYKYVLKNDIDYDLDLHKHPVYKKDKKYLHFMRIN